MDDYLTPPTQYVVDYTDQAIYERLLAKYGSPDDIDLADCSAWRDFTSLRAARKFRKQVDGILMERYDITAEPFEDGTPFVHYNWQERVLED